MGSSDFPMGTVIINCCRVCGLEQDEPPWGIDGKSPSFIICYCCGAEFGYEDFTLKAIRSHRHKWLTNSVKWWEEKERPKNWDLLSQLRNIPQEFW